MKTYAHVTERLSLLRALTERDRSAHQCLKFCLAQLSPEARNLLSPITEKKKAKIAFHKQMGNGMGVNHGAFGHEFFVCGRS